MRYQDRSHSLSDDDLLRSLTTLVEGSRRIESDLVAHIGEVEDRRLYAREACPSMFAYCTEVLHLSEPEAYLRIAAARAARAHPQILEMLADGRLHLSAIAKLAPHLTPENRDALLARASHRSKRQIEELVAEIAPRPDTPTLVRKLPERRTSVVPSSAPEPVRSERALPQAALELRPDGVASTITSTPRLTIEALAPARYKVQFTASAELRDKLERLRVLMRSQVPSGDLGDVIELLVAEKLERMERRRFGVTQAPRQEPPQGSIPATSRHVPAAVRRAVYARDGGRCRYRDERGRRCSERVRLEYHHRYPYGVGGDHGVRNICLLCPAHNQYMAEHDFGQVVMAKCRKRASA